MAKLGRLALFWRAFFLTLVFGSSANAADEAENSLWQSALSENSASAYFNYLSLYPAGDFVDQAVNALVQLGAVGTNDAGNANNPAVPNQAENPRSLY